MCGTPIHGLSVNVSILKKAMNRVSDFYSKPSNMSAYPLYGRFQISQRGGYEPYYVQRIRANKKAAQNAAPALLGLMNGIIGAVDAHNKFKRMSKK